MELNKKRKMIREGIKVYLRAMITASHYNDLNDEAFDSRILEMFTYLRSQGCVLWVAVNEITLTSGECFADYSIEPLIGEE